MPKKIIGEINYSRLFQKQLAKAPSHVLKAFRSRRQLFLSCPRHPSLRDHALKGKFKGLRSINITGDWRALYSGSQKSIIFEFFGTHSQLYKR